MNNNMKKGNSDCIGLFKENQIYQKPVRLYIAVAVFFFVFALISACAMSIYYLPAYASAGDLTSFNNYITENVNTPSSQLETASILSGINKPVESSFDAIRTIVGSAPKDTDITITLYRALQGESIKGESESDDPFIVVRDYKLSVGQSGMFSKTIDLDLGQNYILIKFSRGSAAAYYTALINRKDIGIKKELEQGVVPGKGINPLKLEAGKR